MYEIYLERSAEKDLRKLQPDFFQTIVEKIKNLAENPYLHGCRKIRGSKNFWRIRVGSYRILYEIDESTKLIRIYKVKPRKDAYR